MFTATKSFERFRQPKSVQDEKRSVDNAIPKSTAYKNKRSCKVFEEWKHDRVVKSCTLKSAFFLPRKTLKKEYKLWTRPLQRYVCMQSQIVAVEVRSRSKQFFWGALSFPFVGLNYLRTEALPI